MYKKCHNAIKENAQSQNCKKLLKLIQLAEENQLTFLYAYNRKFNEGNDFKIIKYIEIIDEKLKKLFNINVNIIKSDQQCIFVLNKLPDLIKLNYKEFKILNKRMNALYSMFEEIKKFDLEQLPKL